jgi:hypothetical protein
MIRVVRTRGRCKFVKNPRNLTEVGTTHSDSYLGIPTAQPLARAGRFVFLPKKHGVDVEYRT